MPDLDIGELERLCERLVSTVPYSTTMHGFPRLGQPVPANRDGPQAATAIRALIAEREALERAHDQATDALVKASVAINAAYAQALAEAQGHDRIAERHDQTVREGRQAIREALDPKVMAALTQPRAEEGK